MNSCRFQVSTVQRLQLTSDRENTPQPSCSYSRNKYSPVFVRIRMHFHIFAPWILYIHNIDCKLRLGVWKRLWKPTIRCAFITYNLKKYIKFISKKSVSKVQTIDNKALNQLRCVLLYLINSIISPPNFTPL
jgi:hypothetical protein